jgi:hypothetical protein
MVLLPPKLLTEDRGLSEKQSFPLVSSPTDLRRAHLIIGFFLVLVIFGSEARLCNGGRSSHSKSANNRFVLQLYRATDRAPLVIDEFVDIIIYQNIL